jgi:hypothetical protein
MKYFFFFNFFKSCTAGSLTLTGKLKIPESGFPSEFSQLNLHEHFPLFVARLIFTLGPLTGQPKAQVH